MDHGVIPSESTYPGTLPETGPEAVPVDVHARERRPRTLRVFKRLPAGETVTVRHGMGGFPLTDVYALAYFPVVSHEDEVTDRTWVNFYALHENDASVNFADAPRGRVALESPNPRTHGLPLIPLLRELGVQYDDETHLGSVIADLWDALFAEPSDPFDETSYDASPWINQCCGDRRSMGELRRGGSLDNLWLYFRPTKTINYPAAGEWLDPRILQVQGYYNVGNFGQGLEILNQMVEERRKEGPRRWGSPSVQVTQVDYETLTLRLLPPYENLYGPNPDTGDDGVPDGVPIARDELNVMLLLHA